MKKESAEMPVFQSLEKFDYSWGAGYGVALHSARRGHDSRYNAGTWHALS